MLELAIQRVGRALSEAEQKDIGERIKEFSPQRIDVVSFDNSTESLRFQRTLVSALEFGGWRPVVLWQVNNPLGAVNGILVSTDKGMDTVVGPKASALVDALSSNGISVLRMDSFSGTPEQLQDVTVINMAQPKNKTMWGSAPVHAEIVMMVGEQPKDPEG
jgi:hypothetical protein